MGARGLLMMPPEKAKQNRKLKKRVNKRRDRRALGKNDQKGEETQNNKDRRQPIAFADFQKIPKFLEDRHLRHLSAFLLIKVKTAGYSFPF